MRIRRLLKNLKKNVKNVHLFGNVGAMYDNLDKTAGCMQFPIKSATLC